MSEGSIVLQLLCVKERASLTKQAAARKKKRTSQTLWRAGRQFASRCFSSVSNLVCLLSAAKLRVSRPSWLQSLIIIGLPEPTEKTSS